MSLPYGLHDLPHSQETDRYHEFKAPKHLLLVLLLVMLAERLVQTQAIFRRSCERSFRGNWKIVGEQSLRSLALELTVYTRYLFLRLLWQDTSSTTMILVPTILVSWHNPTTNLSFP